MEPDFGVDLSDEAFIEYLDAVPITVKINDKEAGRAQPEINSAPPKYEHPGSSAAVIPAGNLDSIIEDAIIPADKHSVMMTVSVRKSTFEHTFFSVLTQRNLLGDFFRNILYYRPQANYLLFQTEGDMTVRRLVKNLAVAKSRDDMYTNSFSIGWMNLIAVEPSGTWRNYTGNVRIPDGKHALYFCFEGSGTLDFANFALI